MLDNGLETRTTDTSALASAEKAAFQQSHSRNDLASYSPLPRARA